MRAAPMRSAAGCRRVGGVMAMMREIHGWEAVRVALDAVHAHVV